MLIPLLLVKGSVSSNFEIPQNTRQLDRKVCNLQRIFDREGYYLVVQSLIFNSLKSRIDGNKYEYSLSRNQGYAGGKWAENREECKKACYTKTWCYFIYKKVLIRFNNLMCRLRHRLRILHLNLTSELCHGVELRIQLHRTRVNVAWIWCFCEDW